MGLHASQSQRDHRALQVSRSYLPPSPLPFLTLQCKTSRELTFAFAFSSLRQLYINPPCNNSKTLSFKVSNSYARLKFLVRDSSYSGKYAKRTYEVRPFCVPGWLRSLLLGLQSVFNTHPSQVDRAFQGYLPYSSSFGFSSCGPPPRSSTAPLMRC